MSLSKDSLSININTALRVFLIYFIGFFPLLFNFAGVYYDDWTIAYQENIEWTKQFWDNGSWLISIPTHWLYLELFNSIYLAHLIQFSLPLLIAHALYSSLILIYPKHRRLIQYYCLVFLTLPLYQARISLVCLPFFVAMLAFSLGFYFSARYLSSEELRHRLLSLFFFAYSFVIKSFIVFYLIPLSLFLIASYNHKLSIRNIFIANFLKEKGDFLILPFLSFFALDFIAPQRGAYTNYNKLSLSKLIEVPKSLYLNIESIINPFKFSFHLGDFILIVIFTCLIFLLLPKDHMQKQAQLSLKQYSFLFILFVASLFLAALPYSLVLKNSTLHFFKTRHQLLELLSVPVLVCFLYSILNLWPKIQALSIAFILSTFSLINLNTYSSFLKIWTYNESIANNMAKNKEIRSNNAFIVKEAREKVGYNLVSTHHYYEYSGFAKRVFKDKKRLFVTTHNMDDPSYIIDGFFQRKEKSVRYKIYSNEDFKGGSFKHLISILKSKSINHKELPSILYSYLFNKEKYKHQVTPYRQLKVHKLKEPTPIKLFRE